MIKYGKRKLKERYYKNGRVSSTRILKDVAYLKSVINVERKILDTQAQGQTLAVGTTGNIVLLNGSAQGDDYNQRDGNSIKMRTLHGEGFFSLDPLNTAGDTIKVALVLDRQPNGATTTYGDIYDLSTVRGGIALRNPKTVDRYKVLKSKTIVLSSGGKERQNIKWNISFPEKDSKDAMDAHVKYNGTTNAIASIQTNALYLVYCGNISTNMSSFSYAKRIRFIDN